MADKTINVRIQQKYDTEANWKAKDPVLLKGEQVFTSDGTNANKYKVGNGTAKWSALPYAKADLSKGDVTTALGYTPPISNTWRGIQNNLTSDSTTDSLSAAQGKVLKGLVDGKAASSHTHTKSQITDFPKSLPASDVYGWAKASSKPSYTKSEVGLGNVDNTADANKSVKYAGSSGSSNTVVYTALTNTDLNTLQTEGRWYYAGGGNTCTNIPVESAAFELYVGRNASGYRYQRFTVTSGEIYIRIFDSSNWGNWRKLAFTSDTVTAASSVPWSGITGKPSTFSPSSHNHTISNITDIKNASVNFANSSGYPQGFTSRVTTATWGNQTGTVITDWHTSNGGDIAFRDNSGQLNVVIDGVFYQNEGKNLVLDSANYSSYAAPKSHTHTISNITNLQTTLDGKSNTNHTHDLNPMINTLTSGTSDPVDTDYYIAQYAGGGSTTTTYHRRPHSALWNYIKSKANSVYQPKGSYAASSHTHDDRYYTESEINTKLSGKSDTSHTHNYVVGSYTGNGGLQKPNYFGTNKVGFLMMNATVNNNSQYKDWIIMDCYSGNDVGGGVAIGVNRQSLGAYIMRSPAARTAWVESAELLHTSNYTSYTVTKTGGGASGTWGISISGNASSASSVPWSGVTGKPSSYTPSSHTHSSVTDIGNGSTTTFAYSKSGLGYGDFTWLAAWNGYELRAVNKSLFAQASHSHTASQISDFSTHVYDATISRTANTVLAAPNGKAGSASFRALVAADIPSITKSKITDFPSALPASDVYAWAKASSKPSYSWGEITGKPSTFAPSSHTHNYAGSSSAGGSANWANGASYSNYATKLETNPTEDKTKDGVYFFQKPNDSTMMPDTGWWSLIRTQHPGYSNGYWQEVAYSFGSDTVKFRRNVNGTKTGWRTFAWSDHTHNYAGSSSAGGSATSAVKLDTGTAGSVTQPVYFTGGKPVACSYTLGKSVPSNAVFTDTNTWRPLGTTADTACAGNDSRLSNARPASDVYSWAKASAKPSYSWSEIGSKPSTFTPSSHDHTRLQGTISSASVPGKSSDGFMTYHYNVNDGLTNNMPSTNNANAIITISRHGGDYTTQLGFSSNDNIYYRNGVGTTAWKKMLDSSNYTSYTVTKTGSGASGTWGINVTGSAGSVAWGNVSGRPSSMPASDVYSWAKASSKPSYSWSEISGRPSSLPASDVYAWAKASTKPSYSWNEIGSKPSTFTPSNHTHSYLPLSGGTMTGQIKRDSCGGSWISARTNAPLVGSGSTSGGWNPIVAQKTKNGSWSIGNLNGNEHLSFSYTTDADYNNGKNVATTINLPPASGTLCLTNHTHPYLPTTGGTLNNGSTQCPLIITGAANNESSITFKYKTQTSGGHWVIGEGCGTADLNIFAFYQNGKGVLAKLKNDGQWLCNTLDLSGYNNETSLVPGPGDGGIKFSGGDVAWGIVKRPNSLYFVNNKTLKFRMQETYCYCDVGFQSQGIFNTTTSNGSNMRIENNIVKRVSSASKYKLDIQNINEDSSYCYNLLKLNPRQWFDKGEVERYSEYLTAEYNNEDISEEFKHTVNSGSLNPYYGLVAEDLEAAGLEKFCDYGAEKDDGTKELEGIQYDRIPILTIPILRDLVTCMQKILPSVEKNISDSTLLSEVKEIESRFNSFNPQNIVNKQYAN